MDIKISVKTSVDEAWQPTGESLFPIYLEGCEEINRPNEFRVLARCDFESSAEEYPIWVGDRVKVEIIDNEKGPEFQKTLYLLVVSVEDLHNGNNLDSNKEEYFSRLTFVSEIWRLSLNHGYRILEDMDVPEIFKEIVPIVFKSDPNSKGEVFTHQKKDYPKRPHSVQFDETALEFIDRLLRDEGLSYIVDNSEESERIYLFDAETPLQNEIGTWREIDRNNRLAILHHQRMMPDIATIDTIDARDPNSDEGMANIGAEANVEEEDSTTGNGSPPRIPNRGGRSNFNGQWRIFESGLSNKLGPENSKLEGHDEIARNYARLRNAQINHNRSSITCEIEEMNISPGCSLTNINLNAASSSKIFVTACHFIVYNQILAYADEWKRQTKLISRFRTIQSHNDNYVSHCIIFGSLLQSSITTCNHYSTYILSTLVTINNTSITNTFNTTNNITNITNYITPPQPKMYGVQSATVLEVGSPKDNRAGYVKVLFPWNISNLWPWGEGGTLEENSSGWVRVAQGAAGQSRQAPGAYVGIMYMPLPGSEVLVSFLNGEVDRPIVIGSLYNDYNKSPKEWTHYGSQEFRGGAGDSNSVGGEISDPNEVVIIRDPHGNQIKMGGFGDAVTEPCSPEIGNIRRGLEFKDSLGTNLLVDNNVGYNFTSNVGPGTCPKPGNFQVDDVFWGQPSPATHGIMDTANTTYSSWLEAHHGTVKSYVHGDPVDALYGKSSSWHEGDSYEWHWGDAYSDQKGNSIEFQYGDTSARQEGDSSSYHVGDSSAFQLGNDGSFLLGGSTNFTLGYGFDGFVGAKYDIEAAMGATFTLGAKVVYSKGMFLEECDEDRVEFTSRTSTEAFSEKVMWAAKSPADTNKPKRASTLAKASATIAALGGLASGSSAFNALYTPPSWTTTARGIASGAAALVANIMTIVMNTKQSKKLAKQKSDDGLFTKLKMNDKELHLQSNKNNYFWLLDKGDPSIKLEAKKGLRIHAGNVIDIQSRNKATNIKSKAINLDAQTGNFTLKAKTIDGKSKGAVKFDGNKIHLG